MSFGSSPRFSGGPPTAPVLQGLSKYWHYVAIIAVVAVTAGICLPSRLPARNEDPSAAPAPESADKGNLSYTPPSLPDAPSARSMLVRLAAGTAIVLVLCIGTLWIGRRWLQVVPKTRPGGVIGVVETLALGRQCSLHLIAVKGHQVLVGMDGGGIKGMVSLVGPFEQSLNEQEDSAASKAA